MLICIKIIEKAVTEKSNPAPIIKHVKFMAKKATKNMLEPVAYVKYHVSVMEVTDAKWADQFGVILP